MRAALAQTDGLPPLVEAKLTPPRRRAELVQRARLHRMLHDAERAELTLLSAPTGYGKTTVVRTWCAELRAPLAWITLDPGDNDLVRLWTYVATAVDRIRQGLGRTALQRLARSGASIDVAIDELANGMAAYKGQVVVVVDDLHVVEDPEALASLEYVVKHLPANARLLAISRMDPAIELGRLRGRGALAELRADDLAFTTAEARELLVDHEGIALTDADVEVLVQRTEGWPAGLYLAALWLRGLDDPSAGAHEFAGHQRHVVDFLTGEVLDRLDTDVRSFLLHSAVLGKFTAELCDDVLGRSDSASVLAELERSNLFLVALDGRGSWFRYHALFADLLQLELSTTEPDAEAELHRSASAWFLERGLLVEATEHASAAEDHELVARLLVQHHLAMIRHGRGRTLLRLLDTLPQQWLIDHPVLAVAGASAAGLNGRPSVERRRLLALAQRVKTEHPERWNPYLEVGSGIAHTVWIDRDVGAAIRRGRLAAAIAEAGAADELYVAMLAGLAHAHYLAGDLDEAAEAAQRALDAPNSANRFPGYVLALSTLALVSAERGRLATARAQVETAVTMVRETGLGQTWAGASAAAAAAVVLTDEGKLAEAEREAVQAERLRRGAEGVDHAWTLILLGRIRARRGHLVDAQQALARAREAMAELTDPGRLEALASAVERELHEATARAAVGELTERPTEAELPVLRLLPTDLSLRQIGDELFLSLNTVKTHTRSLYRKLDVGSRTQAVARASALGLLDTNSPG